MKPFAVKRTGWGSVYLGVVYNHQEEFLLRAGKKYLLLCHAWSYVLEYE
jgi:hypothetical protein